MFDLDTVCENMGNRDVYLFQMSLEHDQRHEMSVSQSSQAH